MYNISLCILWLRCHFWCLFPSCSPPPSLLQPCLLFSYNPQLFGNLLCSMCVCVCTMCALLSNCFAFFLFWNYFGPINLSLLQQDFCPPLQLHFGSSCTFLLGQPQKVEMARWAGNRGHELKYQWHTDCTEKTLKVQIFTFQDTKSEMLIHVDNCSRECCSYLSQ